MLKNKCLKIYLASLLLGSYLFFPFPTYYNLGVIKIQETQDTGIKLSGEIDRTRVPLNRTLEFKVVLSWTGDPDDFSLIKIENPTLSNFVITGTSAAHRSEASGDRTHIINEYTYTLAPKELGMGYVESIRAKVKNNILDLELNLITNRIPVEVTDPEREPGENKNNQIWYATPILFLALAVVWFVRQRKKAARKKLLDQNTALPLEEQYLQELKSQFNLNQPDLQGDFSRLSRLLRRYLTEKYSLAALNTTADKLSEELFSVELEDNQAAVLKEILSRSEEITFSGTRGTLEEITRFYTQIEGLFLAGLRTKINEPKREEK